MEASWYQNGIENRTYLEKATKPKILMKPQSQNGEPKSIKNRSKNEVNMGRHLGIDFSSILVDFGSQVGRQNRAKIDAKRHRKNDGKVDSVEMAKKS